MRRITRSDLFAVGMILGIIIACISMSGCNTVRGFALDLAGAAEGSAKNIDAPNRLQVDEHYAKGN